MVTELPTDGRTPHCRRTIGGRRKECHFLCLTLSFSFNPLNAELNPICYLLALLGVHHFLHVSRIRVKSLTLRLLMSYIYIYIYRVSQEECARLPEGVPYVKVYRYNSKHLCPKLNGYGDNGQRKVWSSGGSTHCTCQLTSLIDVYP